MIEIVEYLDPQERSPFGRWVATLDRMARLEVLVAVVRMEQGNLSNVKSVGGGVLEYRIHFGPGYRLYFGREGDTLIILVGGGSKQRQPRDIASAKTRWSDYRERKQARRARMALTRSYRETIREQIESDAEFGRAMLVRAIELLVTGEVDVGKSLLRDYITVTIGFEKLGANLRMPPKSLIRMFSPKGNPQARNLFAILDFLQKQSGTTIRVAHAKPAKRAA